MLTRLTTWFACLNVAACVHPSAPASTTSPSPADIAAVSPALARYTADLTRGALWQRPELSPRDRSLVTLAAMIAHGDTTELPIYLRRALDSGVTPPEISETITHLAFYAGWSHALAAIKPTQDVFAERHVRADQLPAATPELLTLDDSSEAQRAARVQENFGVIAPALVGYTTDILFRELWLRPALAPRDRSLVTVSALVATNQAAQLPYHLNRAMDNGLTPTQVGGVMAQLAFVSGWPSVFSSLPVVKDTLDKRPHP